MLIRSQCRKTLFNLSRIQNLQINKESRGYCIAAYFTEDDMSTIGSYTTESDAIKVLDMIQRAYESSCVIEAHIPGATPYMRVNNIVFEMPPEHLIQDDL